MTDDLYIWTCRCGEKNAMSHETNRLLRRTNQTFFCLHGHPSCYPVGDTQEDILRRERDRLKQQMAEKDDEVRRWQATANDQCRQKNAFAEKAEHERRRANGYKGHAAKITKRAKAGVCPCCNRHFTALERHMATKHPEFTPDVAEPALKVVGGTAA